MTTVQQLESNPFALMMNPEVIFAAMANSDRLARLDSRICRPLDKPFVTHADEDDAAPEESVGATAERKESNG